MLINIARERMRLINDHHRLQHAAFLRLMAGLLRQLRERFSFFSSQIRYPCLASVADGACAFGMPTGRSLHWHRLAISPFVGYFDDKPPGQPRLYCSWIATAGELLLLRNADADGICSKWPHLIGMPSRLDIIAAKHYILARQIRLYII